MRITLPLLLLLVFGSLVCCASVLDSNLVASGAEIVAPADAGDSAGGTSSSRRRAVDSTLSNRPNSSEMETVDTTKKNVGDFPSGSQVPAPAIGEIMVGVEVGDDDKIPERFVIGCNGDLVEAARRWKATCEWREENKVDAIIETPQPRFHDCREVFPVFVHGRSRQGMPVLWERIGGVNLHRADELEIPVPLLVPNYVFINECIWRVVLDKGEDANDDAQFITVEDVGGVRLWHLTPRVLSALRSLTGTMKAHYVERCHKSYIINAPRAFTALWRIVSPMLDPRTRAKVVILGTDFLPGLQKDMDISQIPSEYGGTSSRAIDDSDDERKIRSLVARLNAEDKMQQGGGGDGGGDSSCDEIGRKTPGASGEEDEAR